MVPFELLEAHVEDDGRVFARWKTVADDGDLLVESDWITPDQGESPESALDRLVSDVKALRALHNQPKPVVEAEVVPPPVRSLEIKAEHRQNVAELEALERLYSKHG